MAAWSSDYSHHRGHGIVVASLKDDLVGPVSHQLQVLAWAVGLVLLVITGNVSCLMLAHGEARRRELAVRAAVGASRTSLVRQLLLEGFMLAAAAGAAGSIVAWVTLEPLLLVSPHNLPRAAEIGLGARTLAGGAVIALAAGILIGLLPAARLTRNHFSTGLKAGARGESLSFSQRTQAALVVSELALAFALTVGAALLAQSFVQLQNVPLGFASANVVTAVVNAPEARGSVYGAQRFFSELTERLSDGRGVVAAGAISALPLHTTPPPDDFTIDGRPVPDPGEPGFNAHYVMVTPGAFEALNIPLVRGRSVQRSDIADAQPVAVVNEAAAARYWAGIDPIGTRLRYATGVSNGRWSGWGPWLTVVGIARDVRFEGLTTPAQPAIYVAHAQRPRPAYSGSSMTLVLRHGGEANDWNGTFRLLARELQGSATVSSVRSLDSVVARALERPRFMGWMMGAFATVALGTAALGIYGVIAYGVARRTREIGVRMALGSTRLGVAWLVARQTMSLMVAGFALGAGGAAWMAGYMRALLFGVQPMHAVTYLTVTGILALVVCAAVALPIRRAMGVDPLTALRAD
jgi:putative ABC transport system permease protein